MNYRSISQMAQSIRACLHAVPSNVELIVGIPRSGMLAGSMIALFSNLQLASLEGFLENTSLLNHRTRKLRRASFSHPHDARHILLVDDSASTGSSMSSALTRIQQTGFSGTVTTCVVYLAPGCKNIDIHFETLPHTRIFEWNIMHRAFLSECCVDLDGILCPDPTDAENDDGENYIRFLANAKPLVVPSYPIGRIVTSRLEKYRPQTERWLKEQGIEYWALDMLDLPDAQTRRRLGAHGTFKANVYAEHSTMRFFIESEPTQAIEIARKSGKHALCLTTNELFCPAPNLPYARQASRRWANKGRQLFRRLTGTSDPLR